MIGRQEVEVAWRLIRPHVRRTPVIELPAGALGVAAPLALKLKSLQLSGSFKGRGAFHKLLASQVPAAGIVAASGGNHGAAAAYAARALGHKAEIFVPTVASPTKVARLKSYGAVVHQVGAVYAEARAAVGEARGGDRCVGSCRPMRTQCVFAGAGSVALEFAEQATVRHAAGRGRRRRVDRRLRGGDRRGHEDCRRRDRGHADALRSAPRRPGRSTWPFQALPPMRWAASRIGAPNLEIAQKLVRDAVLVGDDAVRDRATRAVGRVADHRRTVRRHGPRRPDVRRLQVRGLASGWATLVCGANTDPGSVV